MSKIRFSADKHHTMFNSISNAPAFPGEQFGVGIPESIGSTTRPQWFSIIKVNWTEGHQGKWHCDGWVDGELSYTVDVIPQQDYIDFFLTLTNKSGATWDQTYAFNCFKAQTSPQVRDHDCGRHWVRTNGEFKRLIEIPRVFGPRPALQFYSVEGAPPGKDIPFVNDFKATPQNVAIEGWLAIVSPEGKRLVATVSKPTLFTFQNMEFSCIHSSPGFGPLKPGETGKAMSRLYLVEATLEQWYERMKKEMSQIRL